MIFCIGLLISLMTFTSEVHQHALNDSIQAKQLLYSNLFDACITRKDFFETMREKKHVNAIYINYLNSGSALFERSFQEFIQRHVSDALNAQSFGKLKDAIKTKLESKNIQSLSIINLLQEFNLEKDFKIALLLEKEKATCTLYEDSTISTILKVRITELSKYNKEKGNVNIDKNLYDALKQFCVYAKLFDDCYEMVENLHCVSI